jgi:hypothetical protein
MNVLFKNILLLIVAMAVHGCIGTSDANSIDPILTNTNPCSPPCWMGITPGETSKEQAINILEQEELNENGELTVTLTEISWRVNNGQRVHIFSDADDIINRVTIMLSETDLESVIEEFGDPDYMRSGEISDGWYSAYIYYLQKGLSFRVSGREMKITPNMVVGIAYFTSSAQDAYTMLNDVHGPDIADKYLSTIQSWNGYIVVAP